MDVVVTIARILFGTINRFLLTSIMSMVITRTTCRIIFGCCVQIAIDKQKLGAIVSFREQRNCAINSVVECLHDTQDVVGSIPTLRTKYVHIAQSGRGNGLKHRSVWVRIPVWIPNWRVIPTGLGAAWKARRGRKPLRFDSVTLRQIWCATQLVKRVVS